MIRMEEEMEGGRGDGGREERREGAEEGGRERDGGLLTGIPFIRSW